MYKSVKDNWVKDLQSKRSYQLGYRVPVLPKSKTRALIRKQVERHFAEREKEEGI